MKKFLGIVLFLTVTILLTAQADRWQQRALYQMDIQMDVETHKLQGTQRLVYFNNSPDELNRVFYHLYFNAFQPGSMMDVRNQTLPDADPRVGMRISKLKTNEYGYQRIKSLKVNGQAVQYKTVGTILEVTLNEPILANNSAIFDMEFEAQVPVQIRRTGRDNKEGIAYSMAQWYPKMAEYDYQGWHANPYIGREFHGIWGDFDVKITIDKDYLVGGSGYLQNPNEIGHGYEDDGVKVKQNRKQKTHTWHFIAPNVHDFMWAADPDYTHTRLQAENGPMMHFFYQENKATKDNWEALPKIMDKAFTFINENYGKYPYKQYTFIQGGDGGMEYPMATLITGERNLGSLVGVSVHELMHSWYQMVLGTNESLYPWMDEGFTSFASSEVMNHLRAIKSLPGKVADFPQQGSYGGYFALANSGREEPMTTHADHYTTNFAYGRAAYSKGATFLSQLRYVIGEENVAKGLLTYFDTWKFKHPNVNDFIRIMEKQSGIELDWYKEYFVHTTQQIDYGITGVNEKDGKTTVILNKVGGMPMPLDVVVKYADGSMETFYIPLRIMRGEKPAKEGEKRTVVRDWPWTHPYYQFEVPTAKANILSIEIDPSKLMADVNRENNKI
ncbi:MAG: M1 family metallopeptidase [Bacteroidota bacterium]